MSRNLGALTLLDPSGPAWPVMGVLYLLLQDARSNYQDLMTLFLNEVFAERRTRRKQDRQGTSERNAEMPSRNHCCCGKAIITTYSECVSVSLFIQQAECRRGVMSTSVACPALPYFPTLSHKRHDSRGKKKLLNMKCVLILSASFLILKINQIQ
jgi:hypothetical protein